MVKWLFDSWGEPIAFIHEGYVFTRLAHFYGKLDGIEVWNGMYQGEIVGDDRLLSNLAKVHMHKPHPFLPSTPGLQGMPGWKETIPIPFGFKNVDLLKVD
jgi:hypothetical protein